MHGPSWTNWRGPCRLCFSLPALTVPLGGVPGTPRAGITAVDWLSRTNVGEPAESAPDACWPIGWRPPSAAAEGGDGCAAGSGRGASGSSAASEAAAAAVYRVDGSHADTTAAISRPLQGGRVVTRGTRHAAARAVLRHGLRRDGRGPERQNGGSSVRGDAGAVRGGRGVRLRVPGVSRQAQGVRARVRSPAKQAAAEAKAAGSHRTQLRQPHHRGVTASDGTGSARSQTWRKRASTGGSSGSERLWICTAPSRRSRCRSGSWSSWSDGAAGVTAAGTTARACSW